MRLKCRKPYVYLYILPRHRFGYDRALLLIVYGINMNGFHRFQKLYVMQKYIYSSTKLKEREGGKEHVSVIMTSDP